MKTKYKHIYFTQTISGPRRWRCRNNKSDVLMASISYYPSWKKYVAAFDGACVFDNSCLRDIADFLDQLQKEK